MKSTARLLWEIVKIVCNFYFIMFSYVCYSMFNYVQLCVIYYVTSFNTMKRLEERPARTILWIRSILERIGRM